MKSYQISLLCTEPYARLSVETPPLSAADRTKYEARCFAQSEWIWMRHSIARHRYVVLIVEDDVFVRMDLAAELSAAGWSVLESSSAAQALDLCASGQRVDLLVTDINLGNGLTGWDVARVFWLRYATPVIYMSANPDDPQHHVPASLFMRKPCRPAELSEACLHLHQPRKDE